MRTMIQRFLFVVLWMTSAPLLVGQAPGPFTEEVRRYISVDAPIIALTNVTLIDGTGGPVREDQTIVIENGKIIAVGASGGVAIPASAAVLPLTGHSVIPGLVGMHDHMFFPVGAGQFSPMHFSFPRLYLATGVTTIRTTGSIDPYRELNLRADIEEGKVPGPKVHVTGPYLQGRGPGPAILPRLDGPESARRMVAYWAEEGVTWFKAYTQISRAELAAAIDEAHKRGLKVTAHLCSVGFREAVELGIDNLEHGLLVNTEYHPDKAPDVCPSVGRSEMFANLDIQSEPVQATIRAMVARGVPMTSTLSVSEHSVASRPPLDPRVLDALLPVAREAFLTRRAAVEQAGDRNMAAVFKKAMEFERAFVEAGGLLAAGSDPTGNGGVLAGFADQRNVELLQEAGFTLEETIQIVSANGARILGEDSRIGTVTVGKQADLVLLQGDLRTDRDALKHVVTVFKDGVGYDSAKLIESVRGVVGLR
jgi:imidazolonepropionase-like amidohydrolase